MLLGIKASSETPAFWRIVAWTGSVGWGLTVFICTLSLIKFNYCYHSFKGIIATPAFLLYPEQRDLWTYLIALTIIPAVTIAGYIGWSTLITLNQQGQGGQKGLRVGSYNLQFPFRVGSTFRLSLHFSHGFSPGRGFRSLICLCEYCCFCTQLAFGSSFSFSFVPAFVPSRRSATDRFSYWDCSTYSSYYTSYIDTLSYLWGCWLYASSFGLIG
jgi:hypothetical protein